MWLLPPEIRVFRRRHHVRDACHKNSHRLRSPSMGESWDSFYASNNNITKKTFVSNTGVVKASFKLLDAGELEMLFLS